MALRSTTAGVRFTCRSARLPAAAAWLTLKHLLMLFWFVSVRFRCYLSSEAWQTKASLHPPAARVEGSPGFLPEKKLFLCRLTVESMNRAGRRLDGSRTREPEMRETSCGGVCVVLVLLLERPSFGSVCVFPCSALGRSHFLKMVVFIKLK